MKLMVCGKGGTGKTVISILMARAFRELGYVPYILDMDESNETLPILAGAERPRSLVELYGGRRGLAQTLRQGEHSILSMLSQIFAGGDIALSTIRPPYKSTSDDGVGILVIGKIREFGEGCACPLNVLSKLLLSKIKLSDKEVLIVDTDAGVEHVGRGVEEATDGIVAVADPTYESLVIAKHLKEVASRLGKKYWLVLNKVPESMKDKVQELCAKIGLTPDCVVPFDDRIFESCMLGTKVSSEKAYATIKEFVRRILSG